MSNKRKALCDLENNERVKARSKIRATGKEVVEFALCKDDVVRCKNCAAGGDQVRESHLFDNLNLSKSLKFLAAFKR